MVFTVDPVTSTITTSPLAAVILAKVLGEEVEWNSSGNVMFTDSNGGVYEGVEQACLKAAGSKVPSDMEKWSIFCKTRLSSKVYAELLSAFKELDEHLRLQQFVSGPEGPLLTDICVYCQLKTTPIWNKSVKEGKAVGENLLRWFNFMSIQPPVVNAQEELTKQVTAFKVKPKDQGSFEIELVGAEEGKVVTRFPPEPSGYLHIGHAKAVLLNQYFAQSYKGKLIIRFDDTNPLKENCEYEVSILEDLALIGVKGDVMSRTSDYFPQCEKYCEQMIREGLAYCDDTVQEKMREERFEGIDSACRALPINEHLRRWDEMKKASEEGLKNCVRAMIGMQHTNKALRDPVIYRCQLAPHHRTGDRYKVYPTYDFACPIVDSLEGVTHALRTNEYHDRNDQYYWIIDALRLRKPQIWDYSRMSFVYTLLSKRKLNSLVTRGAVSGWDDPRFPTIRGIRRRGLTIAALKEYILMQGPSKNTVLLEWDKLWAVNKRHIDAQAARFTALERDTPLVKITLTDGPQQPYSKALPKHKKNPELGNKETAFSRTIFIEQADAKEIKLNEEVTLMDWGNVIFDGPVQSDSGLIIGMEARMNLNGDFKKTEKKITWLSPDPNPLVQLTLYDYDYLITKKKLEEEDSLDDYLTPVTEFITHAIGDYNLKAVKKGDIIQLERKGFYICDDPVAPDQSIHLIYIPDGKSKSLASKHAALN